MDEKPSLESLLHQLDSSGIMLSRIELPHEKNSGDSCPLDYFCATISKNKQLLGTLTWYQPKLGVYFLEGTGFGTLNQQERNLVQQIYDLNGGKIINLEELSAHQTYLKKLENAYQENDASFPHWQE